MHQCCELLCERAYKPIQMLWAKYLASMRVELTPLVLFRVLMGVGSDVSNWNGMSINYI